MKVRRFSIFVWGLSLTVGFGLVATSLAMAISAGNSGLAKASHRRFYLSTKLLPDHSFYPVLMAVERVKLTLANDNQKPRMLLDAATQRMQFAHSLADEGQAELAEQTLYKSHLYLMQAADMVLNQHQWPYVNQVAHQLSSFALVCDQLKSQIQPSDSSLFEKMQVENQAATDRLVLAQWTEH